MIRKSLCPSSSVFVESINNSVGDRRYRHSSSLRGRKRIILSWKFCFIHLISLFTLFEISFFPTIFWMCRNLETPNWVVSGDDFMFHVKYFGCCEHLFLSYCCWNEFYCISFRLVSVFAICRTFFWFHFLYGVIFSHSFKLHE